MYAQLKGILLGFLMGPEFGTTSGCALVEQGLNILWQLYHQSDWFEEDFNGGLCGPLEHIRYVYMHNNVGALGTSSKIAGSVLSSKERMLEHTAVACGILAMKSMSQAVSGSVGRLPISELKGMAMHWREGEKRVNTVFEWGIMKALGYTIGVRGLLHGFCEQSRMFDGFESEDEYYLHSLIVASYGGRGEKMAWYMGYDRRFVLLACIILTTVYSLRNVVGTGAITTVGSPPRDVDVRVCTKTIRAAIALGIDDHVCGSTGLGKMFDLSDILYESWESGGGLVVTFTSSGGRIGLDGHNQWMG
jgi:hypothetical protein